MVEPTCQVDGDPAVAQNDAHGLRRPADHEALEVEYPLGFGVRELRPENVSHGLGLREALEILDGVNAEEAAQRSGPGRVDRLGAEQAFELEGFEDLLAAQGIEWNAGEAAFVAGVVDQGDALSGAQRVPEAPGCSEQAAPEAPPSIVRPRRHG